jgi:hypothetical protein
LSFINEPTDRQSEKIPFGRGESDAMNERSISEQDPANNPQNGSAKTATTAVIPITG